jgi:hypothetical protein
MIDSDGGSSPRTRTRDGVMAVEHRTPCRGAHAHKVLGRTDDIGERYCRKNAVDVVSAPDAGQKLLHFIELGFLIAGAPTPDEERGSSTADSNAVHAGRHPALLISRH